MLDIEKLLFAHSSADGKFDMLLFSEGVRIPEFIFG